MRDLPWAEREIAAEVAGSLLNAASYIAHRPDSGERLRTAIVEALQPAERELLLTLAAAMPYVDAAEWREERRS